jgi:hypothetical protein
MPRRRYGYPGYRMNFAAMAAPAPPAIVKVLHSKPENTLNIVSKDDNVNQSLKNIIQKLISINFRTLEACIIPKDWGEKKHATIACQSPMKSSLARYIGKIDFFLEDVSVKELNEFTAAHAVECTEGVVWDENGEFATPKGQIPLSRLMEFLEEDPAFHSLWQLQNLQSSPWNVPFIRVVSNHKYDPKSKLLEIAIYIWFTRPAFELIADPAIMCVMENVQRPPITIIPVAVREKPPVIFASSDINGNPNKKSSTNSSSSSSSSNSSSNSNNDNDNYHFSLPGILKYAESSGYFMPSDEEIPKKLKVTLYEFQKTTYKWMLDHEKDKGGINSHFWEEWQYSNADGGSMFYFPMAGTIRLTRPPHTTGGLLCEEMGLGKTVEVIATILGNPRNIKGLSPKIHTADLEINKGMYQDCVDSQTDNSYIETGDDLLNASDIVTQGKLASLVRSKATLIVIPPILLSQWWRELHTRVEGGGDSNFSIIKLTGMIEHTRNINAIDIRVLPASVNDYDVIEMDTEAVWGLTIPTTLVELADILGEECDDAFNQSRFEHMLTYIKKFLPTKGDRVEFRMPLEPGNDFPRQSYTTTIVSISYNSGRIRDIITDKDQICFDLKNLEVGIKFKDFVQDNLHEHDVVITNYDTLQKSSIHFKRIHWHRIILDECQEIKVSTGKIATECARLYSNHRWMVSGTPFTSKIEDLHGELNFLRVWPFALKDSEDGFWAHKIGTPYRQKDPNALNFLRALIDEVMIRHSKSQTLIETGEALIKMPARIIEYNGFHVKKMNEKYLLYWLECFSADVLCEVQNRVVELHGPNSNKQLARNPHFTKLKTMLATMSKLITSPTAVDMKKLDSLIRLLSSVTRLYQPGGALDPAREGDDHFRKLKCEDIIALAMQGDASMLGGMNRDTDRVTANASHNRTKG